MRNLNVYDAIDALGAETKYKLDIKICKIYYEHDHNPFHPM